MPKNESILCSTIRNIYEDYMCGLFPKSFDTIINAVERIRSQSEEKDNVESAWSHKFEPIEHSSDNSIWTSGNEVISCGCCEDCDCEKETSSTWGKSTLFEYSTKELTDELLTRGGIESQWIAPESTYNIEIKNSSETVHRNIKYNGNGPLWIIFNYD